MKKLEKDEIMIEFDKDWNKITIKNGLNKPIEIREVNKTYFRDSVNVRKKGNINFSQVPIIKSFKLGNLK